MAKQVTVQVAGGEVQVLKRVDTIEDIREKLDLNKDHTATINGEPARDDDEVEDYQFVTFAPKVQGGR